MTQQLPPPFMIFDNLSYPSGYESGIDEKKCIEQDIESVIYCCSVSREKAIYALIKYGNEVQKAIIYCIGMRYELKFEAPEKGIYSIIGIPTMNECGIWSENGRPVMLADIAKKHYGNDVKTLEDLEGKNVCVFRRFRDERDLYELPHKYYLQKAKIVKFTNTLRLDMAAVIIKSEGETQNEEIKIQRVCIDWDA